MSMYRKILKDDEIRNLLTERYTVHSPRPHAARKGVPPDPAKLALYMAWHKFIVRSERVSQDEFRMLWNGYLNSRWWHARRSAVLQRAKGICERCGARPVSDIHHMTYAHRFAEPIMDLLGLCRECHSFISGKSPDPAFTERIDKLEAVHKKLDAILEAVSPLPEIDDPTLEVDWHNELDEVN